MRVQIRDVKRQETIKSREQRNSSSSYQRCGIGRNNYEQTQAASQLAIYLSIDHPGRNQC